MKNETYTKTRTCVYSLTYHFVWSVKFRRKVLTPPVADCLLSVLNGIASENGFEILSAKICEEDHVHVYVKAPPRLSVTDMAKKLKGVSALRLLKRFPDLKDQLYNGDLWNDSYLVNTVGVDDDAYTGWYIERMAHMQGGFNQYVPPKPNPHGYKWRTGIDGKPKT